MKYKKIVAFGDSFVQGLIKEPHEISSKEMKRINFVTRLGELYNIPVINFGWRGFGQNAIAYDVAKYLVDNKSDPETLFLVVWSGFARKTEFDWNTYRYTKFNRKEKSDFFIDLLYSNTVNIRGTYSLLLNNKQPFLMLNSFINLFEIEQLNLKGIEKYWINETLFEMCVGKGNLIAKDGTEYYYNSHPNLAKCKHPSEKGHKVIAEKLQNYIEMY